jgi:hypothetical protein
MIEIRLILPAAIIGTALLFAGCAPREVVREAEEDSFVEDLHRYEKEFDPTAYNTTLAVQRDEETPGRQPANVAFPEIDEPEVPEYAQGFRIQLYSTSDIEAAQEVYTAADSLFTGHWIYVVYEVPFYKVRLGDFSSRPQANRMMAEIVGRGFRDAWVVPDRIVKDPPAKEGTEDGEDIDRPDRYE